MAATGKTPILLYGSTTPTNAPAAGNLTNSSDGCEIAINVADKNLFFKDSSNNVNTVPIRQSSASSNGWLSSTDWTTFNGKAPAFTYTAGYIPFGQGTTTPNQSSNFVWDNTNNRLGINRSPNYSLDVAYVPPGVFDYGGINLDNGSGATVVGLYRTGSSYSYGTVGGNQGWIYASYGDLNITNDSTGIIKFQRTSGSETMRLFNSGGVSIGNTTDPGAGNLSVNSKVFVGTATSLGSGVSVLSSDEAAYNLRNSGASAGKKWTLGANAANTVELYNQSSAGVYIADGGGSWSSISDERLKDIIEPITNASEKVRQLRSVIGKYKTDDEGIRRSFLIAQDVEAVFPEACNKHSLPSSDDKTEYLGVTYTDIIPLLVATINELQDRLDALENK